MKIKISYFLLMKILKCFKKNINNVSVNLFFVLFYFLTVTVSAQKYTVVLDAGHGGKDNGASRGDYVEKKIVLSLVLKVGELLEKDGDVKVIYTRKTDDFIEGTKAFIEKRTPKFIGS